MWIIYLYLIILGLLVGSLVNVFIYRWPIGEQWVKGRSKCMQCKHQLSWIDLVPVFSFLVLGGKCRYCKAKLSWQYPTVEIINAIGWLIIGYWSLNGNSFVGMGNACSLGWDNYDLVSSCGWLSIIKFILLLGLWSMSLASLVIDFKHLLLPDQLWMLMTILSLVALVDNSPLPWVERLIAGLLGLGSLGALHLFTRGRGMGLGDVKLAGGIGLLLGRYASVAILGSFWMGSVVGIMMLMLGKARFGKQISFGPFMIVSFWLIMVWGEVVLNWYLGIMGMEL